MRKRTAIISILLIMALCISCNLDNTQGIGSMVMNDQYEESFRSMAVIGISSDSNSLYLKTDKGIRLYTNEGSGSYGFKEIWGNGDDSKTAWLADDTGLLIEENGEFQIIDLNGALLSTVELQYNSVQLKSIVDCYTADGKNFTLLFGNKEKSSDQLYAAVITVADVRSITSSDFHFYSPDGKTSNLSIIGDKALRYSEGYSGSTNTAKYSYCYDITDPSASFSKVSADYQKYAIVGAALMNNGKTLAVDSSGRIYISNEYKSYNNSGTSIAKLPIISDANRTMFIFNGKVIICSETGATSKSATNLTSSMTPILLKGCSSPDKYLLMTELSGAYLMTVKGDSSIELKSLGDSRNSTSISDFF